MRSFVLLFVVSMALPAKPQDDPSDQRMPVPSSEQTARARQLIDAIYKDEFAASGRPAQVELARTLLKRSREPDTELPMRYVLLLLARDTAAAADDEMTALSAVDELTLSFQVDVGAAKVDFLAARCTPGAAPDRLGRCFEYALGAVRAAFAAEDLATANTLVGFADGIAGRTDIADALLRAAQMRVQLHELESDHDAYASACARLRDDPADAAANYVAGRHLCFLMGAWERGLRLLVLGDHPDVASVAALELKVPADPASRLQVADRWFDLAERDSMICRAAIRRHAVSWYRRVLRDLKETDRERVTKRLAEIDPVPAAPKNELKLDPVDWELFRWTGTAWKPSPIDRKTGGSKGGVFTVRNAGDPHGFAKLTYSRRVFTGDFTIWLKFRGQLRTLSLGDIDWTDRVVYLDQVPSDRTTWRRAVISRTQDGVCAWIDALPVPVVLYNITDEFIPGFFCVELNNGNEVEVRDFAIRGGASQ